MLRWCKANVQDWLGYRTDLSLTLSLQGTTTRTAIHTSLQWHFSLKSEILIRQQTPVPRATRKTAASSGPSNRLNTEKIALARSRPKTWLGRTSSPTARPIATLGTKQNKSPANGKPGVPLSRQQSRKRPCRPWPSPSRNSSKPKNQRTGQKSTFRAYNFLLNERLLPYAASNRIELLSAFDQLHVNTKYIQSWTSLKDTTRYAEHRKWALQD
jgi:hypothetical protein